MPATFFEIFTDKNNELLDWDTIQKNADEWYQQRPKHPGFFTPFKDSNDFIDTLCAPISYPIQLGIFSVGALLGSGITAIGAGAILTLSPILLATGNDDTFFLAMVTGGICLALSGAALFIAAGLALAAVASVPFALVELATRTTASVITPVVDYFDDSSENTASLAP